MIRYRYAQHLEPPAPFVNVSLIAPTTTSLANLPAQIDSAADRTVLPGRVVRTLGLVEDGRLLFQGFGGEAVELPVFLVDVQVHDRQTISVRAVLGENEPCILLGRDVLNAFRFLLDGPNQALEFE
jgi:hypothetical protein